MKNVIIMLELATRMLGLIKDAVEIGEDISDSSLMAAYNDAKTAHENWINRERNEPK